MANYDRAKLEDLGKLLLRLTLGVNMLLHGVHKAMHGIDGITGMLAQKGLPTFIGPGVYLGELVAPIFIIVGVGTRLAGLMMSMTMVIAIGLAHSGDIFTLKAQSGSWGIELPGIYLLGGIAIALLGSGRFAVSKGQGRFD
jgi:putative oxidoreductase